uniref:Uncharacterized protein n=1 Tax=Panagrellus redivivus TaxID=6233 RepID=A0A7E4VVD8_PANRE
MLFQKRLTETGVKKNRSSGGQSPSQKTTDERSRGHTDCCQPARARKKSAVAGCRYRSIDAGSAALITQHDEN